MGSKFDVSIVTGGSSGIGKSIIEGLSKLDKPPRIFNLSRSFFDDFTLKTPVEHIPCNLADRDARNRAFDTLERSLRQSSGSGGILLINNAGFGLYGELFNAVPFKQEELIEVNIAALVSLTTRLLPEIKRQGGTIINIASTAAFQPTPGLASYGASKAFVLNWTLALNEELRGSGARAIAFCPGPTSTNFFTRAGLAKDSFSPRLQQTSDEVAQAILKAAYFNGGPLIVPGIFNKILTRLSSLLPLRLRARVSAAVLRRTRSATSNPD